MVQMCNPTMWGVEPGGCGGFLDCRVGLRAAWDAGDLVSMPSRGCKCSHNTKPHNKMKVKLRRKIKIKP